MLKSLSTFMTLLSWSISPIYGLVEVAFLVLVPFLSANKYKISNLSGGLTVTSCNFLLAGVLWYVTVPNQELRDIVWYDLIFFGPSKTQLSKWRHTSAAKGLCWNACCCWSAWEWEHDGSGGWCDLPELDLFTLTQGGRAHHSWKSGIAHFGTLIWHHVPYQTIHTKLWL